MNKTFEENKEEIYPLFRRRCGKLLRDFVSRKEESVCSLCSDSCTENQKTGKALQGLIEFMVREAAKGCDDKVDIFMYALCPYLTSLELFEAYAQGKNAKRLAKEMQKGRDKLLAIIKESDER